MYIWAFDWQSESNDNKSQQQNQTFQANNKLRIMIGSAMSIAEIVF